MRKRRCTLLVTSLLFAEYPPSHSNGVGMYSEGFKWNFSTNEWFREKASICRYASSSPHINSHAGRSVSMGFPCLDINFMTVLKYSFSTEAVELVCTPGMQRKSITSSLLSCPMVLHESKTNDPNVSKFDLNALK